MKNDLQLKFNCPVDIHSMPKCDGGYACSECQKKVFDYSKMSLPEFHEMAEKNKVVSQCGIFKAYQLEGAFGDWRDSVTKVYRRTANKARVQKHMLLVLPFIAGLMILVGCGRKGVCGMMYESDWTKTSNNVQLDTSRTDDIKSDSDQ